MPGPFPSGLAEDSRILACACLVLISHADHARAALFPMPHPAWPAPHAPAGYSRAELADAAQGALCGFALHIGSQLCRMPGALVSPDWRVDDWMDESRCRSQLLDGRPLAMPQAFIHLSGGAERAQWPAASARFLALCEGLLGPSAAVLDGEKAYRSEAFWNGVRRAALSVDEKRALGACSAPGSRDEGPARI